MSTVVARLRHLGAEFSVPGFGADTIQGVTDANTMANTLAGICAGTYIAAESYAKVPLGIDPPALTAPTPVADGNGAMVKVGMIKNGLRERFYLNNVAAANIANGALAAAVITDINDDYRSPNDFSNGWTVEYSLVVFDKKRARTR